MLNESNILKNFISLCYEFQIFSSVVSFVHVSFFTVGGFKFIPVLHKVLFSLKKTINLPYKLDRYTVLAL